jgi:misacylated tRNA(Ala) deacylase
MTELLYHTDAYLQEFDAAVTTVLIDERAVVLDKTAFYPGGGGQPCDLGSLNIAGIVYVVDKVKKQGDDVLHFLGGASPLPSIGSASHGTLDWVRRHKLMRTHTALHVLCGTIFRDYGAQVTGGNMEPLKGHLDFEFEVQHVFQVLRNKLSGKPTHPYNIHEILIVHQKLDPGYSFVV